MITVLVTVHKKECIKKEEKEEKNCGPKLWPMRHSPSTAEIPQVPARNSVQHMPSDGICCHQTDSLVAPAATASVGPKAWQWTTRYSSPPNVSLSNQSSPGQVAMSRAHSSSDSEGAVVTQADRRNLWHKWPPYFTVKLKDCKQNKARSCSTLILLATGAAQTQTVCTVIAASGLRPIAGSDNLKQHCP